MDFIDGLGAARAGGVRGAAHGAIQLKVQPRKFALIWNDRAGSAKGVSLDEVKRGLLDHGAEVLLECVSESTDCRACARK